MAGNSNSGKSIPFRMSESMLESKIKTFREERGQGQFGMVSWPMFCAYIGYSVDEVAECYKKGKEGENAYSGRAVLLERFYTEVKGMTLVTCNKQQTLAQKENERDYLNPKIDGIDLGTTVTVNFGVSGDPRSAEAMK